MRKQRNCGTRANSLKHKTPPRCVRPTSTFLGVGRILTLTYPKAILEAADTNRKESPARSGRKSHPLWVFMPDPGTACCVRTTVSAKSVNCRCSGIDIWCYNLLVRSKASHVIVTLILSICVVCPLIEMFDQWDHTAQTGNDTEYAFVILGLCVGVSYTFARAVLRTSESLRSRRAAGTDGFLPTCFRSSLNLIVTPVSASPPLSTLRI